MGHQHDEDDNDDAESEKQRKKVKKHHHLDKKEKGKKYDKEEDEEPPKKHKHEKKKIHEDDDNERTEKHHQEKKKHHDDDEINNAEESHLKEKKKSIKKTRKKKKNDEDDDDDDEEESQEQQRTEMPKKFVEIVKRYVEADDHIRDYQRQAKLFKEEKKTCEKLILKMCESSDVSVIGISGGKLKVNKSQTKAPLRENIIQQALLDHFKQPDLAFQITKIINKGRPLVDRKNIKRVFDKKIEDD